MCGRGASEAASSSPPFSGRPRSASPYNHTLRTALGQACRRERELSASVGQLPDVGSSAHGGRSPYALRSFQKSTSQPHLTSPVRGRLRTHHATRRQRPASALPTGAGMPEMVARDMHAKSHDDGGAGFVGGDGRMPRMLADAQATDVPFERADDGSHGVAMYEGKTSRSAELQEPDCTSSPCGAEGKRSFQPTPEPSPSSPTLPVGAYGDGRVDPTESHASISDAFPEFKPSAPPPVPATAHAQRPGAIPPRNTKVAAHLDIASSPVDVQAERDAIIANARQRARIIAEEMRREEAAEEAAKAKSKAKAEAEEAEAAAKAKAAEYARLAAEAMVAVEARLAAESKAAEEARLAAESKVAEEARLAAEARAAEEARVTAEAKAAEEARLAAEMEAAEEAAAEAASEAAKKATREETKDVATAEMNEEEKTVEAAKAAVVAVAAEEAAAAGVVNEAQTTEAMLETKWKDEAMVEGEELAKDDELAKDEETAEFIEAVDKVEENMEDGKAMEVAAAAQEAMKEKDGGGREEETEEAETAGVAAEAAEVAEAAGLHQQEFGSAESISLATALRSGHEESIRVEERAWEEILKAEAVIEEWRRMHEPPEMAKEARDAEVSKSQRIEQPIKKRMEAETPSHILKAVLSIQAFWRGKIARDDFYWDLMGYGDDGDW